MSNEPTEPQSNEESTIKPSHPQPSDHAPKTISPNSDRSTKNSCSVAPVENFEIIEELGRGGMGVVYKAIDQNLDRPVALKMIIGGSYASQEDLTRFRQEAFAAAKLDHENIVPIYDISDQDSQQPYFSMKLIEGGSLESRREEFASPGKAVNLVLGIAKGVRHAHERGILHRDLKPANILIDESGRPMITDLGLAKSIEQDSGLTQTGMVMGTPGFMAPEQAAGKSDVTTSADVYSIGAILYWLIAGRTPITGSSHMDIILQTINSEADSLRLHCLDIDRNLDLICRKALKNSTEDRYATVDALLRDLEAWLVGDPISIRPPNTLESVAIWVRKNFRTLAISMVAGLLSGGIVGSSILLVLIRQMQSTEGYLDQLGDQSSNWIDRNFQWVANLPSGVIDILPIFFVWTTIIIAALMIGFLRPKKKDAVFAAALTAGLLASAVAFTLSLGWSPIIRSSVNSGINDIELLSDAIWLDSDPQRELAIDSIRIRYPGLDKIDIRQRGPLVARKIIHDQAMGIPGGIWEGIGVTIFLALLPIFLCTAFSGLLWLTGARGFEHFGKTFEIGIYCTLLCVVLTKFFSTQTGLSPGWLVQSLVIVAFGFAIFFCLKKMSWRWRVIGFLISSGLFFWGQMESGKVKSAARLAAAAKTDAEFEIAAAYFRKYLHQVDSPAAKFQLAVIEAYLENEQSYERVCESLLSGWTNMHRPEVAERTAKVCLLRPDLQMDIGKAYRLAETASQHDQSHLLHWFQFCRALSELRQSNFIEAVEWNIRCRATIPDDEDPNLIFLRASTHIVDCLAYREMGDETAAKVAESKTSFELLLTDDRPAWINRLVYEVLIREIRNLPEKSQPPNSKS